MRITLVHKPSAGDGQHAGDALVAAFRRHGHAVTYGTKAGDTWARVLDDPADAVVVAGGDGTVSDVAQRLAGTGTPLAVLPLGTANNIACALGLIGPNAALDAEVLAAGLPRAARRRIDLGRTDGPWGTRTFVEGTGVGAVARAIYAADHEPAPALADDAPRGAHFRHDLAVLLDALCEAPLRRHALVLDGEETAGDYALVEVTNTGLVGPNVPLAADADPGDGLLDVVMLGAAARERLVRYLEARLADPDVPAGPPALPVARVRSVRVRVEGGRAHVGDTVWPETAAEPDDGFDFAAAVVPGALVVLGPPV